MMALILFDSTGTADDWKDVRDGRVDAVVFWYKTSVHKTKALILTKRLSSAFVAAIILHLQERYKRGPNMVIQGDSDEGVIMIGNREGWHWRIAELSRRNRSFENFNATDVNLLPTPAKPYVRRTTT